MSQLKEMTIEEIAEKLSQKNCWIRKGLQNFFETWEQIDFGCEIIGKVGSGDEHSHIYLMTGSNLVWGGKSPHCVYDWNKDCYPWNFKISLVREICKNLPAAIEKIKDEALSLLNEKYDFPVLENVELIK